MQRLLQRDAGIVEGNVQSAISSHNLIYKLFNLGFDPYIRADVRRFATFRSNLLLHFAAQVFAPAAESDLPAFRSEGYRSGSSNS